MKTIILIHGRSWKPEKDDLHGLWLAALQHGFERDRPDSLDAFEQAEKPMAYFGDVSNEFLADHTGDAVPNDMADRQHTLGELKGWEAFQFNKRHYNELPGKESFKEGIADVLSPVLNFFHLSDDLIAKVAPDIGEYWKGEDSYFGSAVREALIPPLTEALDRGGEVCLVAHSLGSMIAYDTLWKLSYRGEYRNDYADKKIDLMLTLGSPLADATVQKGLFGAKAKGSRKYPTNLRHWVNVAAEDDYISHDSTVAGDYRNMKRWGLVDSIQDIGIYNLAVRSGKSNPHHSGGYLIHPKVIKVLADWLQAD